MLYRPIVRGIHRGPVVFPHKGSVTQKAFPCREVAMGHLAWPPGRGIPLQWRHNGYDGVSNHQPHQCLLNRLFGRRSKKTSKLRVTGLCAGNSPGTVNSPHRWPVTRKMFPFWWRHHAQDWYGLTEEQVQRYAVSILAGVCQSSNWHTLVKYLHKFIQLKTY